MIIGINAQNKNITQLIIHWNIVTMHMIALERKCNCLASQLLHYKLFV